ncbi:M20/M25/M40 family metallo-hydrolase [Coraliomargarita sp. SDUM461004]|uniref:M20/M25/M40 family metallo-hydrolase n=1 Tax=Thalassobacterium sedimentorum TaxID=3041258 RepID=A0ABU1AQE8_9BACT|nr:M20/M25/M40 family metallo-hydrolase [Coraliomargarita sp. SDUM461004]MDQ8195818.1 M20/M25/M40 family metallo-hydrolase [Coraliomargarita sp. SDUM461004]
MGLEAIQWGQEQLMEVLNAKLPDALARLKQWVDISSYTLDRAGVEALALQIANDFEPLGFQATRLPSTDPLYADHWMLERKGCQAQGRSVACISHLDTVFPEEERVRNTFEWSEDGTRIYGPGTVDIKGGTAVIYLMLEALLDIDLTFVEQVDWRIFLNSSEEVLNPEFAKVVRPHLDAQTRACLVFEADEACAVKQSGLVSQRKGRLTYRVTASGLGAHAGSAHHEGVNAIALLAPIVQQIESWTDYDKGLTFNVGMIHGGEGRNRVAQSASLEGEMRAFEPQAFAHGKSMLLALPGAAPLTVAGKQRTGMLELEILQEDGAWPKNAESQSMVETWQAAGAELGIEVYGTPRGGLSDGNHFWESYPTIDGLGPSGGNLHASERCEATGKRPEYVNRDSFVPKALLNCFALKRLLAWDV